MIAPSKTERRKDSEHPLNTSRRRKVFRRNREAPLVIVPMAVPMVIGLFAVVIIGAQIAILVPAYGHSPSAGVEMAILFSGLMLIGAVAAIPAVIVYARRILRKLETIIREPNLRFGQLRRMGSFGRLFDRIMDRQEYRFRLVQGHMETQAKLIRLLINQIDHPVLVTDGSQSVVYHNDAMRKQFSDQSVELPQRIDTEPPFGEVLRHLVEEGGYTPVRLNGEQFYAAGIIGWFPEREQYDLQWHGMQYVVFGTREPESGVAQIARVREASGDQQSQGHSPGRPDGQITPLRGWRRLFHRRGQ